MMNKSPASRLSPSLPLCFLTWRRYLPPDDQVDLAVPRRPVHQVDDVSVRLPHHWDPVHEQQLVSRPQPSVQVGRTLLDDRPDQDLLAHVWLLETGSVCACVSVFGCWTAKYSSVACSGR